MRLTKQKKPIKELLSSKQQKKSLISNYQNRSKEPESIFLNKIITKNPSFRILKERIKTETNSSMKDIFSNDESRLKAIKYLFTVSNRENPKNEKQKLKHNLSSISYDLPLLFTQNNKNKRNIKNYFYKKNETISPINKVDYKTTYIQKEPQISDSPVKMIFQRNRNNINDFISKSEINIQYLNDKDKKALNKFKANNKTISGGLEDKKQLFYSKIKHINNRNIIKRNRNYPQMNYDLKEMKTFDDINQNKTTNNFYIHKQINKSGMLENNGKVGNNNIKKFKNNNQGINVFYSTKNINYDFMQNFPENNTYKEDYCNFQTINKNKTQYDDKAYIPEEDNESDTNTFNINYIKKNNINSSNKMKLLQKKKKPLIRIINSRNYKMNNNENYTYYGQENLKKKNGSLLENELLPNYLNKTKDRFGYENNNSDNLSSVMNSNDYDYFDNFSFHKKISTNYKNKKAISSINNNSVGNDIFLKKAIKDNSEINKKKNNKYKIYSNDSFNIFSNIKNKIIFDNENDIVDYINDKFMKEQINNFGNNFSNTGYFLCKIYRDKILFKIKIEDDINKTNKILKEKNIKTGNQYIQIISIKEKENLEIMKRRIISLENDIEKIKKENDSLNKKDFLKNELINKLDKEKQNITEENKKLINEIDKLNKLNEKLKEQLEQFTSDNITKEYKEENVVTIDIKNKKNNIKVLSNITNNEGNISPSSADKSNNLSIHINNSNIEFGLNSKKTNPTSIFRLSKISEIKKIDNNNDSGEREIKNNLDVLNENIKNAKKNNLEINPFNNKDEY